MPLRHAAPSPPQLPDLLHRLAKAQSHRPPDFLSGHPHEDGKSIEGIMHRGRILLFIAVFVTRMEDTRLPKCVMTGELMGSAGCVGG